MNHGNSFIEVCVLVCVRSQMNNFHLLSISVIEAHTSEIYFDVLYELLNSICGLSYSKISVATDEARYMAGRVQGAVTEFESASSKFYNIWCDTL